MVYSVDEIKARIHPVAEKYGIQSVYLFGSYARKEANERSDIDILIDRNGSKLKSLFDMGSLYEDLRRSLGKDVDVITTQMLSQDDMRQRMPMFIESVHRERIRLI